MPCDAPPRPGGLRHLVLANAPAAYALWTQSAAQLMQTMPEDVQEGLSAGRKDVAKYRPALFEFYAAYGCMVSPPPKDFMYSLEMIYGEEGDPTVASAG